MLEGQQNYSKVPGISQGISPSRVSEYSSGTQTEYLHLAKMFPDEQAPGPVSKKTGQTAVANNKNINRLTLPT